MEEDLGITQAEVQQLVEDCVPESGPAEVPQFQAGDIVLCHGYDNLGEVLDVREHAAHVRWIEHETGESTRVYVPFGALLLVNRPNGRRGSPRFLTLDEIANMSPPAWLIEDILPQSALTVLYGAPGCGKTFLALDMALCVAFGTPWHQNPVKRGSVVFVAGEGGYGFRTRIAAWRTQFLGDQPVEPPDRFRLCPDPPRIGDNERLGPFVAGIQELEEPPSLIVIDTLARVMVGMEENSARDMGVAIEAADSIRRSTDATVLLVHHSGKDPQSEERGSSALRGAADCMIKLSGSHKHLKLSCEKMKDAPPFDPIVFHLESVRLGDEGGRPVTSLIPKEVVGIEGLFPPRFGTTLEALVGITRENGGATSTEWKEAAGLKGSTFYRHRNSLCDGGYVRAEGSGRKQIFYPTEKANSHSPT